MKRLFGRAKVIWAILVLIGVSVPAAGFGRPHPRPDLKVVGGSVGVSNANFTGSVVVGNTGGGASGRSTTDLLLRTPNGERLVAHLGTGRIQPGSRKTVSASVAVPGGLSDGTFAVKACADGPEKIFEHEEGNNCRRVGTLQISGGAPVNTTGGGGGGGSSVPSDPIPFSKNKVFTLNSPESNYFTYVPSAYKADHHTPITLFVWMHGCGGEAAGDIFTVSPGGNQSWISIALGGREGACWNPDVDQAKVLAAIADIKTHFNINSRRVILGGYSSGGDLAYRTAFYNARSFAGVLAENTAPFRDTGSTQQASIAATGGVRFHIVHLAHLSDGTYPIAVVRSETNALAAAGFPIQRIEKPGHHYDNSNATKGTDHDLQAFLLPHIDDGWLSP